MTLNDYNSPDSMFFECITDLNEHSNFVQSMLTGNLNTVFVKSEYQKIGDCLHHVY
jgi:hypothetical protein